MGENAVCRLLYPGGLLESSLPGPNIGPARLIRVTSQISLVGTLQGAATRGRTPEDLSWVQRTQANRAQSTVQYPKGVLHVLRGPHGRGRTYVVRQYAPRPCEVPSVIYTGDLGTCP